MFGGGFQCLLGLFGGGFNAWCGEDDDNEDEDEFVRTEELVFVDSFAED